MEQVDTKVLRFHGEKMAKLEKELELAQEIYADQKYTKIVENSDIQDKIEKIILKHGPFTGSEIDVFVRDNLNRLIEEIIDDFKDIRNAVKEYGVTAFHPIMPHLIYLEFFGVNENLLKKKVHKGKMEQQTEKTCVQNKRYELLRLLDLGILKHYLETLSGNMPPDNDRRILADCVSVPEAR